MHAVSCTTIIQKAFKTGCIWRRVHYQLSQRWPNQRNLDVSLMEADKFQVSRATGFLPEKEPLKRLPEEFSSWEETIEELPALIDTKQLRYRVDRWPLLLLSRDTLPTERHWQRAYHLLTFVGQGYIWMLGVEGTPSRIPQVLAKPWWTAAEHLGLPTVGTYAAVILYNWKLIDPSLGLVPENLGTLRTYTGTRDEEWFYLMSVFSELAAAPGIAAAVDAYTAMEQRDSSRLLPLLSQVASSIEEVTKCINRTYEECQPDVFYNRVRPFQSGFTDPTMFPSGGVVFEGVSDTPQQFAGASAAQTSLFPVFDILLGVRKTGSGQDFLATQRKYMPCCHREFLSSLAEQPSLRNYIVESQNVELIRVYNQCVQKLAEFRGQHIILATRMILIPAHAGSSDMGSLASKGTGGTDFMSLLKNIRDDTLHHLLPC